MPSNRIAIVFTGGTIGMTREGSDGSSVPTLTGSDIARATPDLADRFQATTIEFGRFPGPHMTSDRVLALRDTVDRALVEHDGVVIAHGTDTIEETAFLLDLFHESERPVVVVGAMRTMDEPSWDGPMNLLDACLVASSEAARARGVMVLKNRTIHAASEATKADAGALDAFVSPHFGPLGSVDLDEPSFHRSTFRRYRLSNACRLLEPRRVELLAVHHDSDGTIVDACVDAGFAGLVVLAMGRGNVPPRMFAAIGRAVARGTTVVICSRCWGGRAAPAYGYEGGGAALRDAGAIFCPTLGGTKARIALGYLLAERRSAAEIGKFYECGNVA